MLNRTNRGSVESRAWSSGPAWKRGVQTIAALLTLACLGCVQVVAADRIQIAMPDDRGWPRISIEGIGDQLVRIQASTDLRDWREIGRGHGRLDQYPDAGAVVPRARFYRGSFAPRTVLDDWKNQVVYPDDPLRSPDPGYGRDGPRWIKFAILLDDPYRVYFQDSVRYPFHYDFAIARLDPFSAMTRPQFDAVSLYRENQQVVLGAILFASAPNLREWAVQFVGKDPYPAGQVADWIDLVRAMVLAPDGTSSHYFPTYEQEPVARANLDWFRSRGIEVGSAGRWAWNDQVYSLGWAIGRLVFVPASDLALAYREGWLRPDDLLLIDVVPAEIPPVAGIVTLAPATPNAHAVLLAQSFGVPFVYVASEPVRDQLRSWAGRDVLLRADVDFSGAHLKVVDVEGRLEPELRAELLSLKAPPRLVLPPLARAGQLWMPVADLGPNDVSHVGGKAAHFGLLRRAIPNHSPSPAIALTFDLWEEYLDQTLPAGGTLRDWIHHELGGFTWPPDMARLQTALARVRDQIRTGADFDPAIRLAVLNILIDAGFDLDRRIRFRSSTNMEDTEQFSGAGLYDSFSGCLGDDLFPDDDGPSRCNPEQPSKRGVFRAIRRVYASFYNDHAYLERLRHGIDESQVGMGVLVHYSFPDEIELANGVATFEINQANVPNQRSVNARLVTQAGAVSVANPDGNAVPELVHASSWAGGNPWLDLRGYSSLVPLGGTVLDWEDDYRLLFGLLDQAARLYEAEFPDKRRLTLNFEYKKVAPDGALSVKQIRAVPGPPIETETIPWLLDEETDYFLFQGEFGDLFANHRLKSAWQFQTANVRFEPNTPSDTFHRQIAVDLHLGLTRTNLLADIRSLPDFHHERDADTFVDRWTWTTEGDARRVFELRTWLPLFATQGRSPVLFLSDGRLELAVSYSESQVTLGWDGPGRTTTDHAMLARIDPVGPLSLLQTRQMRHGAMAIETRFYWPPEPAGPIAGYTAPLQAWVQTTITGLASQPIVLGGDFAQTYRPGHHNFHEEFLFDPHLEPGLDPGLLEELVGKNIRGIVASYGHGFSDGFWIWGMDDTLRRP